MQSERSAEAVWVVGATQGIGAAIADRLSKNRTVHAFARSKGADFGDASTAARLLDEHGVPWAWVHTPGAFFEKPVLATTDDEWQELLESNLMTFVRSARRILPAMAERGGGRVVTFGVAGLSVDTAKTRGPAYFAVKAALRSCVRTLAAEYAEDGVTLHMISPGAIEHELSHRESQERVLSKIPAGRLGRPADIVGLVEYLVSSESAYATGQEICVDGGLSLMRAPL